MADQTSNTTSTKNPSQSQADVGMKRDLYYDNPKADLVIVSQDNVIFRADSWIFAKKSKFVKDLLAVPSQQHLGQAKVPLDHKANVIRYFIDLVIARDGTMDIALPIEGFHELFQFCDRFEAPTVAKGILRSLLLKLSGREYPTGVDAWEVFKIAANQDDAALAQAAIKNLAKSGYTHRAMFFDDPGRFVFADIPLKYAKAFYESGFKVSSYRQYNVHGDDEYVLKWEPNSMDTLATSFGISG